MRIEAEHIKYTVNDLTVMLSSAFDVRGSSDGDAASPEGAGDGSSPVEPESPYVILYTVPDLSSLTNKDPSFI